MRVINTKAPIILLIGDICALFASLWITLLLRYQETPSSETWQLHVGPFLLIFLVWILVFYLAGLYEKHTSILKNKLPLILFNAHAISSLISASFFYFSVFFSITPKTVLVIFVVTSFILLYSYRILGYSKVFSVKKQNAILIGDGDNVDDLYHEVNHDKHYAMSFVLRINPESCTAYDFESRIRRTLESSEVSVIVIDLRNKNIEQFLPKLYALLFDDVRFIDLYKVYEDVFDKVPLTLVRHSWFIEYISGSRKIIQDLIKRIVDVSVAIVGGVFTLLISPLIILAIKLENPRGNILITQTRVGQNGKPIKIYKFRSMHKNEDGVWIGESQNKITKVGAFLRKSSVDEFPQFWNILKGDLSLVGPRPDMTGLESRLSKEIPHYSVRYVIKPGLTGWAQTRQDVIPNSIEENRDRLAYDLFYIKNRSLFLDIKIIFKTIRTLLTRGAR